MFGKKKLGDILSSFYKTVDQLKKLEDENLNKSDKLQVRIVSLSQEKQDLQSEARQSAEIRSRIEALVGA